METKISNMHQWFILQRKNTQKCFSEKLKTALHPLLQQHTLYCSVNRERTKQYIKRVITPPVCRDGCREHSPGTVDRVHNTRLAPARPPRRSAGPLLPSGCNQLQKESGNNENVYGAMCAWIYSAQHISLIGME